ncbi:MAG: hypothetical protein V3T86_11255 [Planctomycetota bacterium]
MSTESDKPAGVFLYAVLFMLGGFIAVLNGLSGNIPILMLGILVMVTGNALRNYRAWAWFVTTFGLLFSAVNHYTRMVVEMCDGTMGGAMGHLAMAVFFALSLRYLARYSIEVHFRPHITEEAH